MTELQHKDDHSFSRQCEVPGNIAPNKIGRANRRPASPFDAGRQFGSTSCAPPSLSAAVAHLWR